MQIEPKEGSKRFQLNKEDGLKIIKSLGIATATGAVLALADALSVLPEQVDFGTYHIIAVAVVGTIVNAMRKWVNDNRKPNGYHLPEGRR